MKGKPIARRAATQRIVAIVVVFAAATFIYQQTIPVNRTVRARLSRLVVAQPGVAGYKEPPTTAKEIANSSNAFAAVKTAAKTDPSHTGGYVRAWSSTTSKYGFAEILAAWLPTASAARNTLDQANTGYLGKSTYTTDGFSYQAALTTAGIPGSLGASYLEKATKTTPALTLAVTMFRQGLVVVVVDTLGANPSQTDSAATTIAKVQAAHLTTTEPGFTLTQTTRPPLATAIFAAATLATAAAALLCLEMLTRARRRRQLRRAARTRYRGRAGGPAMAKTPRTPTR
jgi:hypothetical protein